MQRADYEQAVGAARRWIAKHGRYLYAYDEAEGA